MPERVVDGFEPVDIEKQHITFLVFRGMLDAVPAFVDEHPAVGEPGQLIVVGQVFDPRFIPLVLGDVRAADEVRKAPVHPSEGRAEHPEP